MGEYATRRSDGQRIKIGTCEDMYYLRADQRHLIGPAHPDASGNVDPNNRRDALDIRFRFPWPSEDGTLPGEFEEHDKAVAARGYMPPEGVNHYSVQFTAQAGYVTSLDCPEKHSSTPGLTTTNAQGIKIGRNGFRGSVLLAQQKLLANGRLVPVVRCGGCGAAWRLEDPAEIEALAVAFRAEGDRKEQLGQYNGTGTTDRRWYDQVADRILAGANLTAEVTA